MGVIEKAARRLEQLKHANAAESEKELLQEPSIGGPFPTTGQSRDMCQSVSPVALNQEAGEGGRAKRLPQQSTNRVSIDLDRLGRLGLVSPGDPKSLIAEELRDIKRPILRNATGKGAAPVANGNLVMITSALPSEGKSTTAVNLAMSIALEVDYTVLLVDADVANPSIPAKLGVATEMGLLDVLSDSSIDVGDVLIRTNIESLSLLPSGKFQSRATELLSSDVMNKLLRELASRYSDRIIVFDSPPLLRSNEARAIATQMGQVVVVVGAESTTHDQVRQALAAIEVCPVRLIMLNKSRLALGTTHGGYGYGYGR
ncbi:MAG: AAA family ATPase [Sterolibacteriaceae bacterium]|uniref:non-specific protein-tyrosine kinase n=1 Tax=Candidatus Methylophosphatis roskildensis TaxID=2899263 RepID=A0A9D7HK95_9PROT|nr:AAA family ATPase [Candidatus Methylophosphatis roskildensis]MBK7237786.1 AAA family ATPase [Sterolibacteriaceae bacterium]